MPPIYLNKNGSKKKKEKVSERTEVQEGSPKEPLPRYQNWKDALL